MLFLIERLITNKIVWSHVAYYNFTAHENKSGIACSSDSIVYTALNAVVVSFKNPTKFFMLSLLQKKKKKNLRRMGYLCIPLCICISSFSRDSQGCRCRFRHRESFSIHSHSDFIHNKRQKSITY